MGSARSLSSLKFDFKIIEAKNIKHLKAKGNLFVRCYLPPDSNRNKRSIGFNTREIPTNLNDLFWNESFLLECSCGSMDVTRLKQQSFVFELRMRKEVPVFGAFLFGGSTLLLGKAEITMEEILESPNMVFDKWVCVLLTRGHVLESQPELKVEIRVVKSEMLERKNIKIRKNSDECGCKNDHGKYCACDDFDVFARTNSMGGF